MRLTVFGDQVVSVCVGDAEQGVELDRHARRITISPAQPVDMRLEGVIGVILKDAANMLAIPLNRPQRVSLAATLGRIIKELERQGKGNPTFTLKSLCAPGSGEAVAESVRNSGQFDAAGLTESLTGAAATMLPCCPLDGCGQRWGTFHAIHSKPVDHPKLGRIVWMAARCGDVDWGCGRVMTWPEAVNQADRPSGQHLAEPTILEGKERKIVVARLAAREQAFEYAA